MAENGDNRLETVQWFFKGLYSGRIYNLCSLKGKNINYKLIFLKTVNGKNII